MNILPGLTSYVFAGGCLAFAGFVLAAWHHRWWRAVAVCICLGAAFQVAHLAEHTQQLVAITMAGLRGDHIPQTPWAAWLITGFTDLSAGHRPAVGNELLHFYGDAVFTSGLVSSWALTHSENVKRALIFQGAHQAEHCLLASSTYLVGTPLGITTLMGHGPLWLRIIAHFGLNAAGTWLWWQARHDLADAVMAQLCPARRRPA